MTMYGDGRCTRGSGERAGPRVLAKGSLWFRSQREALFVNHHSSPCRTYLVIVSEELSLDVVLIRVHQDLVVQEVIIKPPSGLRWYVSQNVNLLVLIGRSFKLPLEPLHHPIPKCISRIININNMCVKLTNIHRIDTNNPNIFSTFRTETVVSAIGDSQLSGGGEEIIPD